MSKSIDDTRINNLLYQQITKLLDEDTYSDVIYNTFQHSKIIYGGQEVWNKDDNWKNPILIGNVLYIQQSYDVVQNKTEKTLFIV